MDSDFELVLAYLDRATMKTARELNRDGFVGD